MSKAILLFLALLVSLPAAELVLTWDHVPEDFSNLNYRVYSETNITTLSTNSPVTIVSPTTNAVRVVVTPGRRFWMVTATNLWSETPPSNVAGAPGLLLTNITGTKLTKP